MEKAPNQHVTLSEGGLQQASYMHYPQQYHMALTMHGGSEPVPDDDDSDDDNKSKATRRKATEKPEGSDQKRQAFSKRKRGIVLKAYQLYKLTDAKVFMFMMNDKGSSWAYSTPGFGTSLHPTQLRRLRELAGQSNSVKRVTEVMAHPRLDEHDHRTDDRHMYVGSLAPLPLHHDLGSEQGLEGQGMDPTILAARAAAARDRDAQRNMARRTVSKGNSIPVQGSSMKHGGGSRSAHTPTPTGSLLAPMSSGGMLTSIPSSGMYTGASGGGMLGPIMLGPDGGYVSESMMAQTGQPMTQVVNMTHMTSSSTGLGDTMEQTITIPFSQDQSHTNTTQANAALTGQILTDAQGNMYRIVQESLEPGMVMPSTQSSGGCLVSSNTDVLTSGSSMSQPSMVMMQAPMPRMTPTGPQAQQRLTRAEPDLANSSRLATLAAVAADSTNAADGDHGTAPQYAVQPGGHMIQLDGAPGNGPVMLNTGSNSGPVYVQAGSQMATYVTSGQYGPGQLVQMSGPQQHMGGYTMAMPQDVQGSSSYPAGQIMMFSQDRWQ